METERRILKSTSVLFTAGILSQAANFVFVVVFARANDPAVLGEYSFALSLGALIGLLVSLGANRLLLRRWSEDPGSWQDDVGVLLPAQAALATLLCVAVYLVGRALGLTPTQLQIIVVVTAFQLLTPVWGLLAVGFTASERMGHLALADLGIRLSIMLIGGAAAYSGVAPELTLLVLPLSALVAFGVLLRLASAEFGAPRLRIDPPALIALWRESMTFFFLVALTVIYTRVGLLLLRSISGAEAVGVFAPAERLVMAAGILHATFGSAVFPPLVRLAAQAPDEFRRLANRCVRLVILLTLPLATVVFVFAEDAILLMFGSEYRAAVDVLRVTAWLIALRGATVVLDRIAIAIDRRSLVIGARATALATLVLLSVVLLPSSAAIGLAIALLCAQCVKLGIVVYGLHRAGQLPSLLRPSAPVAGACAFTLLLAAALTGQALWLKALAVAVTGAGLLYVFGAIRRPDLDFLRHILRGRPSTAGGDGD